MNTEEFDFWCRNLQLPDETRKLIEHTRASPPSRKARSGLGVSIQFESHKNELALIREREIESGITLELLLNSSGDTATSDDVYAMTAEESIFVDEAKQEVLEESINKRFEIDHIVVQVATFPFYLATITNNEGLIVSFSLQRLDEKDNKKPIIK